MSDNLTNAVEMISGAIDATAEAVHQLGLANADTEKGALELLSQELRDGTKDMADAIRELAAAVRDSGGCQCR